MPATSSFSAGTNHAWSNRSDKPVKMLYVLIDGELSPGLQAKLA